MRPRTARRDADADLERYAAEAQHHRNRLALYRARVLGPNPTSTNRLRELQEVSAAADLRLARAKARPAAQPPTA